MTSLLTYLTTFVAATTCADSIIINCMPWLKMYIFCLRGHPCSAFLTALLCNYIKSSITKPDSILIVLLLVN